MEPAPDNIAFCWRNYRVCNWVRCLEGDIDSSHINYLHRTLDGDDHSTVPGRRVPGCSTATLPLLFRDGAPHLDVIDTDFGVLYAARRHLDDERGSWRMRPFLFPFHTLVGGGLDEKTVNYSGKAWVPMDD
jgi:hypothetical protein